LRFDRRGGRSQPSFEVKRRPMDPGERFQPRQPDRVVWTPRASRSRQRSQGARHCRDMDRSLRKPVAVWRKHAGPQRLTSSTERPLGLSALGLGARLASTLRVYTGQYKRQTESPSSEDRNHAKQNPYDFLFARARVSNGHGTVVEPSSHPASSHPV
jgi:hypothetical protein